MRDFHNTTKVLMTGTAVVREEGVPYKPVFAVLVRNLYGQLLVWGEFGFERRKNGTFKKWSGMANNANTERVSFLGDDGTLVEWQPPFRD